jgi:hypothetical protein
VRRATTRTSAASSRSPRREHTFHRDERALPARDVRALDSTNVARSENAREITTSKGADGA